jgi:hypothetical protein
MNKDIKNILLEYIDLNKYKKFKNTVYKYLDHELSESELENDNLDYDEKLRTLPYIMMGDFNIEQLDAEGIIFEYLLDKGENPLTHITFDDLKSRYYGNDIINLLENTGWFDKYMEDEDAFPQTFSDVEKKGDRFYLVVDRWDELSGLFNNDDRDLVERIMGEDWTELYGYFEADWENEVVDNLNEKSIKHIKDYIKEGDFIGQEMSEYSMDDEHGHILTEDMVNDTETILRLIDEEDILNDLRIELFNQYRWAYEQAGEDELFGNVKDEIEGFLGSEGKWVEIKKDDGSSQGQQLHFDITYMFYKYMIIFMEEHSEMPGEYHGEYFDVLSEVLYETNEYLSIPNMDYFYPDSTKTEEYFNYNIEGNI